MKKRIFTAVEISDEARRRAAEYSRTLREGFPRARAGWDKPEKMHLTMKFLGEIDGDQITRLIEAVQETAAKISPFKLQIAGTGVFPSPRQARVLWLGVKDEKGSLQKLNEVLEKECEKRGFAREKRSFKAHLTIARLKERAIDLAQAHLAERFEPVEFEVSELVVFESELRPTGSVYSVVSRHELKGGEL